jgi:hypothetical protein
MPNQKQVQEVFDRVQLIDDRPLMSHEVEAMESLVEHPGLAVLLGLMAGARQGFYLQLSNMPLSTEPGRYQGAVLQGQIKGFDLVPQIILEAFPPAGDGRA